MANHSWSKEPRLARAVCDADEHTRQVAHAGTSIREAVVVRTDLVPSGALVPTTPTYDEVVRLLGYDPLDRRL